MSRSVLACLICTVSYAAFADDALVHGFTSITKSTRWRPVDEISLRFPTYHPQGMTIVGERIYLSSVEVRDRAKGMGTGHLFETDWDGKLRRSITLGEGPAYHPGGIDFDGEAIWVSVAEYRPDSTSIVYAVTPATMEARRVFTFNDHLGAIAHNRDARTLVAVSWGSRRIYEWETVDSDEGWRPESPEKPLVVPNLNHYIDYQDVQVVAGTRLMLFSGLNRYRFPRDAGGAFGFGGIDLVNLDTLRPVHQLPVPLWVRPELPMTQNPFYVGSDEDGLRFYFAPEDDNTQIYVYKVAPKSGRQPNP